MRQALSGRVMAMAAMLMLPGLAAAESGTSQWMDSNSKWELSDQQSNWDSQFTERSLAEKFREAKNFGDWQSLERSFSQSKRQLRGPSPFKKRKSISTSMGSKFHKHNNRMKKMFSDSKGRF